MLKDHCTIYQKLAMEKKGLARPGPAFDPHTFYCLTQEIIKFVVYGTELEELEEKTVVVGFKEVRHVSPRTLEFMASHLSKELHTDALRSLLGIRGCDFKGVHGENLDGSYSKEPPDFKKHKQLPLCQRKQWIRGAWN
ncbi:hypothetical protein FVE85_2169 [Porphyridium purpureum]|uniref:Uncharacterized protein n=1 Tax=Porphyridium purpureum TaxID=35688 RepID=A0A5J4YZ54_PORPP|nr:hypothetical protein FVE85_2169 [Porphyridium purpureum]|eukprot:POR5692..scf209_3